MHDLYDHKFFNGNIAEKLKETLKQLKIYEYFSKEDIQNIVYSCENLGFSSNILEKRELSHEGKISQDAEISHFYDKLLKIKELMNTDIAKEIAIEMHKFLENFLK